jgi:hypothetical protein
MIIKTITIRPLNRTILASAVLLGMLLPSARLHAQDLKTIDPPGGGKIVYGQVVSETTEAGAMGSILRNLHQSLGERPQVGKLFQVHGTQSVAVFFGVTRHDQGTGKQPLQIAGLIIATKVSTSHVEAALVSDDASRFPKTLSPMMKTLFNVWHPLQDNQSNQANQGSNTGPAASSSASSSIAALHTVVLSDRSASVGLPDGWQLVPQRSNGGTLAAFGPNGETAELGSTWLIGDTNHPLIQKTLQQLRAGYMRNSVYAHATYYPNGGDPAQAFVYLMKVGRQRANMPEARYNFTSETPIPAQGQRCVRLTGTADLQDGKGPREIDGAFCQRPTNPRTGSYMTFASTTLAPMALAARERATLTAIRQSFQVDMNVVNRQAGAIAAPAIHDIDAVGVAAANQAREAHRREDIHNSSVYQHWDDLDKRSQEFGNYQLGYSVIATTDNKYHGTFWNQDADALVESNPDKFEYVNAPNYWKGVDY